MTNDDDEHERHFPEVGPLSKTPNTLVNKGRNRGAREYSDHFTFKCIVTPLEWRQPVQYLREQTAPLVVPQRARPAQMDVRERHPA